MNVLVMVAGSRRYGSRCASCGERIRAGRRYVIDAVDPSVAYHVDHAPATAGRGLVRPE